MMLRVPCVHRKWDRHETVAYEDDAVLIYDELQCPGGREPTVEETTQWLAMKGLEVREPENIRAFLAERGIPD